MTTLTSSTELPSPLIMLARRSATRRRSTGFTLLELLVVCSLLVLALGLVMPQLSSSDSGSFQAQVRRAVATLSYARRAAIVQASPQTATLYRLDPTNPDYDAQRAAHAAAKNNTHWLLDEALDLSFQLDENQPPARVDTVELTFFPQGGSTGGLITLNADTRSARIRVDPITGRIATAFDNEVFDDAL